MTKKSRFNILMAGLISGIVAITTATLGISGTVIGSVLSSILYQILSSYSEEKISNRQRRNSSDRSYKQYDVNIGGEVVYLLPLIVITLIEVVFLFSSFLYPLAKVFHLLEAATNQNLFRVMGLGMILLSFYPFFKSNNIRWNTGFLTFITGIFFLFRGFIDSDFLVFRVASLVFTRFDFFIGLIILFILFVIILQVVSSILSSPNAPIKVNKVHNPGNVRTNPRNKVDFTKGEYNSSTKSINASGKTEYFFNDKFEK